MSKAIMVAGMACGGTSCVAGILHNAGVDMGISADIEGENYTDDGWIAYKENPRGQYEDDRTVRLSWDILGGYWFYPQVRQELTIEQQERMLKLIGQRNDSSLWGMKAVSFAFTGPWFLQCMHEYADMKLIVVRRDEKTVLKHFLKRFQSHSIRPLGALVHLGEVSRALGRLVGVAGQLGIPAISIEYEDIVGNPEYVVDYLLHTVFDDWDPRTPEQIERAVAFVDPTLNHAVTP